MNISTVKTTLSYKWGMHLQLYHQSYYLLLTNTCGHLLLHGNCLFGTALSPSYCIVCILFNSFIGLTILFVLDVVSIPKTSENFRLLYDTKGRFRLHSIRDEEAKVCYFHLLFLTTILFIESE